MSENKIEIKDVTVHQFVKDKFPKPWLGADWVVINDVAKNIKYYDNDGLETFNLIIRFKGCVVLPAGHIIFGTHPQMKKIQETKVLAFEWMKIDDKKYLYINIATRP